MAQWRYSGVKAYRHRNGQRRLMYLYTQRRGRHVRRQWLLGREHGAIMRLKWYARYTR